MICMMMAMSMLLQQQQQQMVALQQRVHELEAVAEHVEPAARPAPRHLVAKKRRLAKHARDPGYRPATALSHAPGPERKHPS